MTQQEILDNTKTNWLVEKRALYDQHGNQSNTFGIYRTDNNICLGTVGSRYVPTQNHETLDMLLEASSTLNLELKHGGLLENGKKIYYHFPIAEVEIGKSSLKRYITALNSHDGSSPIGFGLTNVNVYCSNTFYQALKDLTKVKHTSSSKDKLKKIVEDFRNGLIAEEVLIETMIQLSNTTIPDQLDDDFILSIIGGSSDTTKTKNRISLLKQAINVEKEYHGDNAYALFNGFTRYTNHLISYDSTDDKTKSIISGVAYNINNKAFTEIVENFLPKTSNSYEELFAEL